MVCIEAQAVGAIVVNFGIGGTREFTRHRVTGFIERQMSNESFVESILDVMTNETLARIIRTKARENVVWKFSYQNYIKKTIGLYDEVLRIGGT